MRIKENNGDYAFIGTYAFLDNWGDMNQKEIIWNYGNDGNFITWYYI